MIMFEQIYALGGLNEAIFLAIQHASTPLLDAFATMISTISKSQYFLWQLALWMIITWYWLRAHKHLPPEEAIQRYHAIQRTTILLVVGYILCGIWIGFTKSYMHFPRPITLLPAEALRWSSWIVIPEPKDAYASFVSGHATSTTFLVTMIWSWLHKKGRSIAIVYLLTVYWSRMVLARHFPMDLMAGAFSGFLIALAVSFAGRKILTLNNRGNHV